MSKWENIKRVDLYDMLDDLVSKKIKLEAQLKTAKEENALMYDVANAENVTLMGKVDKLLADNKQLKQDLGDSEDNAHELQTCYDEMLPICLRFQQTCLEAQQNCLELQQNCLEDLESSCPDSECCEKCMAVDWCNEEKKRRNVQ